MVKPFAGDFDSEKKIMSLSYTQYFCVPVVMTWNYNVCVILAICKI
jgi:hypothetical protein